MQYTIMFVVTIVLISALSLVYTSQITSVQKHTNVFMERLLQQHEKQVTSATEAVSKAVTDAVKSITAPYQMVSDDGTFKELAGAPTLERRQEDILPDYSDPTDDTIPEEALPFYMRPDAMGVSPDEPHLPAGLTSALRPSPDWRVDL